MDENLVNCPGKKAEAVKGWYLFWLVNFAIAVSAFAVITVVVLFRGSADLRAMFRSLDRTRRENPRPRS